MKSILIQDEIAELVKWCFISGETDTDEGYAYCVVVDDSGNTDTMIHCPIDESMIMQNQKIAHRLNVRVKNAVELFGDFRVAVACWKKG